MIRTACLLVLLFTLFGCGAKETARRYPMQGIVKAVDTVGHTATVDAGKIDGWMEAMVMEYPVKPAGELDKIHVGDRIEATVVVDGSVYYVTDLKVAPKE